MRLFHYFRPLSWGLSFNAYAWALMDKIAKAFSSPFLGTFFQSSHVFTVVDGAGDFSSPFLGTFFQFDTIMAMLAKNSIFVPFLGDFLSISIVSRLLMTFRINFRPLSWGLSFNFRRFKCKLDGG